MDSAILSPNRWIGRWVVISQNFMPNGPFLENGSDQAAKIRIQRKSPNRERKRLGLDTASFLGS